jgi:hypothetical protein
MNTYFMPILQILTHTLYTHLVILTVLVMKGSQDLAKAVPENTAFNVSHPYLRPSLATFLCLLVAEFPRAVRSEHLSTLLI